MATAGDETAASGGVMYADEGPYTIEVRHVEEIVGMIEKRRVATESGRHGRRQDRGRDRRSQGRDRRQDGGDGW